MNHRELAQLPYEERFRLGLPRIQEIAKNRRQAVNPPGRRQEQLWEDFGSRLASFLESGEHMEDMFHNVHMLSRAAFALTWADFDAGDACVLVVAWLEDFEEGSSINAQSFNQKV